MARQIRICGCLALLDLLRPRLPLSIIVEMDPPNGSMSVEDKQLDAGQVWAYRAGARDRLTRVEVLRIGTSRPARVRVRFLEEEFEGREEWVPPARLKVRWEHVDGWRARDQRWNAARDVSWQIDDEPEGEAAEIIFSHVIDPEVAWPGYNQAARGMLLVADLPALCAQLGLQETELRSEPLSFTDDDGTFVAPASTLLKVAQRAAERHAGDLLAYVEECEEEARQEAIHGSLYRSGGSRGGDRYVSPEICAKVSRRHVPVYDLIRQWCGDQARERFDELKALRVEVRRLGRLVESAVRQLRNTGADAAADQLERDLGVPIETIRRATKRD